MSPYQFYWNGSSNKDVSAFVIGGIKEPSSLTPRRVDAVSVVRPVVSLKYNTLISGTGAASDPYVVQGLQ